MENLKKIQQDIKKLESYRVITSEELSGFLNDVANVLSRYTASTKEVNQETKDTLNLIVKQVNLEHDRILADVKQSTLSSKFEVTEAIKQALISCKAMCDEIMAFEYKNGKDGIDGIDGKDADEEVIIEKVLVQIPPVILDTPEQVISKINNAKTKIKGTQIEGLVETVNNIARINQPAPTSVIPTDVYLNGTLLATHVRKFNFTSGATFSNDTVTVTPGGGSGLTVYTTASTIDDSNVTFVFATAPTFVTVNGKRWRNGSQENGATVWTNAGGTVTLANPIGTGGDIYAEA